MELMSLLQMVRPEVEAKAKEIASHVGKAYKDLLIKAIVTIEEHPDWDRAAVLSFLRDHATNAEERSALALTTLVLRAVGMSK